MDTDDLAVMDIRGDITWAATPSASGAKVYGFVAVPVPAMISGQIRGIDFWTSDSDDIEAFFNFIYGFESHLYLFDDDGELDFSNDYEFDAGDNYEMYDISVNAPTSRTSRSRSWPLLHRGRLRPPDRLTITGGRVTMKWDVLRSGTGTISGLKSSGSRLTATPSRPVRSSANVRRLLRCTSRAPITQFYTSFGTGRLARDPGRRGSHRYPLPGHLGPQRDGQRGHPLLPVRSSATPTPTTTTTAAAAPTSSSTSTSTTSAWSTCTAAGT